MGGKTRFWAQFLILSESLTDAIFEYLISLAVIWWAKKKGESKMTTREAEEQKFCNVMREIATGNSPVSKTYPHKFRNLKAVSVTIEKKAGRVIQAVLHLNTHNGVHDLTLIHPQRPMPPDGSLNKRMEWSELKEKLEKEHTDCVEVHSQYENVWSIRISSSGNTIAMIHCRNIKPPQ